MTRFLAALLCTMLASACGDRPGRENAANGANAAGRGGANEAREPDEVSSVMREEVVAEVEEPSEAPPPPPPQRAVAHFGEQGAELSGEARPALDALLPAIAQNPNRMVEIRGHSDSRGSDRANLKASQERAEAVRTYLLEKGVPAERIRLIPLGETRPVAPNANADGGDSPEGRARNRRVEVELAPAAPPPGGVEPQPSS